MKSLTHPKRSLGEELGHLDSPKLWGLTEVLPQPPTSGSAQLLKSVSKVPKQLDLSCSRASFSWSICLSSVTLCKFALQEVCVCV